MRRRILAMALLVLMLAGMMGTFAMPAQAASTWRCRMAYEKRSGLKYISSPAYNVFTIKGSLFSEKKVTVNGVGCGPFYNYVRSYIRRCGYVDVKIYKGSRYIRGARVNLSKKTYEGGKGEFKLPRGYTNYTVKVTANFTEYTRKNFQDSAVRDGYAQYYMTY